MDLAKRNMPVMKTLISQAVSPVYWIFHVFVTLAKESESQ